MSSKAQDLRVLDTVFPDDVFYSLPEDVRKYIRCAHDLALKCIREKNDDCKRIIKNTHQLRAQMDKAEKIYSAQKSKKEKL